MRRYDVFLAVGQANRAFYLAAGVAPSQIVECPHFVENDRFRSEAARVDAREQRRRFGVPDDAVCVTQYDAYSDGPRVELRRADAFRALLQRHPWENLAQWAQSGRE